MSQVDAPIDTYDGQTSLKGALHGYTFDFV